MSPTTGRRTWRVGRDWSKLRHALLNAREYAIHDGCGRWFPLGLRYLPDALMRDNPDTALLDELVVLDVALPEGATSGPPVALPAIDALMVQSPARWRAFIAAHCIAWIPGITRVPVMRGSASTASRHGRGTCRRIRCRLSKIGAAWPSASSGMNAAGQRSMRRSGTCRG